MERSIEVIERPSKSTGFKKRPEWLQTIAGYNESLNFAAKVLAFGFVPGYVINAWWCNDSSSQIPLPLLTRSAAEGSGFGGYVLSRICLVPRLCCYLVGWIFYLALSSRDFCCGLLCGVLGGAASAMAKLLMATPCSPSYK
ncbi:hypothetical protein U1Q18_021132 [Sarracenia purpurea var. burkii]